MLEIAQMFSRMTYEQNIKDKEMWRSMNWKVNYLLQCIKHFSQNENIVN